MGELTPVSGNNVKNEPPSRQYRYRVVARYFDNDTVRRELLLWPINMGRPFSIDDQMAEFYV